jgi:redox-sensitive bicupin YhaK (pirin superfamily)
MQNARAPLAGFAVRSHLLNIPADNFPADADANMTDIQTIDRLKIERRGFATLGKADHGWLNANHHFSFASYYDPARMNWGNIRVWNDDEIAAQSGFPAHQHDNMEIITYVREGAITHKDSMGNTGRTEAGDVQVMSAGTGVTHSEYNIEDETCRLFQIWVLPRTRGVDPAWDQKVFPPSDRSGAFSVLASGYDDAGALSINADARVLGARIKGGDRLNYDFGAGHHGYLVVAKGNVTIGDITVSARDGVAISGDGALEIYAVDDAELVMVDSV